MQELLWRENLNSVILSLFKPLGCLLDTFLKVAAKNSKILRTGLHYWFEFHVRFEYLHENITVVYKTMSYQTALEIS